MNDWSELPNIDPAAEAEPPARWDIEYAEQTAQSIIEALKEGRVRFRFYRVTYGSSRDALGTLNQDLFSYAFKGGGTPKPPGLVPYWDFGRGGWRSFYVWNVQSYRAITGIGITVGPRPVIQPKETDEDGEVIGPAIGLGRGKQPRSRSGQPLTVGSVKDGIVSGLTMRVLDPPDGLILSYAPGAFVLDGLVYNVPHGGTLAIAPNLALEPRTDVVAANWDGSPYLLNGWGDSGNTGLQNATILAVLTVPPLTDGIVRGARLKRRNVSYVPR